MMMNRWLMGLIMSDNWQNIRPSDHPSDLRMRRVDPEHPMDFFYGKDYQGNYIFTFRGNIAGETLPKPTRLAGIDITLVKCENGIWEIYMRLLDATQVDIFKALCSNLMSATRNLERSQDSAGVQIILSRIQRWQELLKARKEELLSKSQIIGLFGELLFLKEFLLKRLSPLDALMTWRGPYGDEQDFLVGSWMIEVKTQLSSSDRKLHISSVDQLDITSGQILICYQILGIAKDKDIATQSLNSLVDEFIDLFVPDHSNAMDMLQVILIEYGYMRREEYDDARFMLNERVYYHVTDEFPALRASILPAGVEDVRYSIKVEFCKSFIIEESEIISWVFGSKK
jgi:hypothetical protein